ncbi:UNVERIFIED_CONTAM: Symplekin [Sesamum angustifolium]|uniref:Symplekin n=1 Tax=Sesamum angustifolium TaxID=2727405 RepID=A0AAW2N5S2_9LAMI
MVGVMAAVSRAKLASRINSIKQSGAADIGPKLDKLRRLRDELLTADSVLLVDFLSPILDLLSDRSSPVRKFIIQMIGEIGLKHLELLPDIIPALIAALKDDTPAVARQAITCGVDIFRCSLVKVAIQGLYSSEFDKSLKSSWECVLKFRDEIYSMAFKVGNDGRRLPALKFVESMVLLYTPDPNGSLEPPPDQVSEGKFEEFNVSWLRGGHPILNVRDLSAEASQNLGLLLDQLRFPSLKSHSYLVMIVLIKSLSTVARKRPAFYGRILPVLLGLDPSNSTSKGLHLAGVHHALRSAFESCLNCTHPGAAPWRDRLVGALEEIKVGRPTEQATNEISENKGRAERPGDAMWFKFMRKRTGVLDSSELTQDDMSGKRARSTPDNLKEPGHEMSGRQEGVSSSGQTPSRADVDSGPVQQLVAMFAALVAQGEKASASLEILISSISADLLAEVVMANLRNLPPQTPKSEGDEEPLTDMVVYPDTHIKHLSLLLGDILSESNPLEKEMGTEDPHHSQTQEEEEPPETIADSNVAYDDLNHARQATVHVNESVSAEDIPSAMETGYGGITSVIIENEGVGNGIPGLALSTQDDALPEDAAVFPRALTELEDANLTDLNDANQDTFTNLGMTPIELDKTQIELAQSLSTDRSEELSPKAAITDTNNMNSSTATSVWLSSQLVLPKISAPVICLADEQKDQLQQLAFVRIVDAYKQVTVAGGSQIRFSILAHSGMEFPLELDPWKLLKTHILSDYVNHEGHELTLRVLYSSDNDDREMQGGDRVTQGLSTVWSLILTRPPIRDACLKIALKSAVHHLEEVRMKAIRLVANKLYPLSSISEKIEDFAKEMLLSVVGENQIEVEKEADGIHAELQKDENPSSEKQSVSLAVKEISIGNHQNSASESIPSSMIAEVQRCMSLYFALCTKKHSLFRQIFDVYKGTSKAAKQAVHHQIPLLVRTIGSSRELLGILSDPPTGSEGLVTQVVHTLTDGTVPSPDLLTTVKRLYDTKLKDIDILIPILAFLPKDEVLLLFPHLVNAPLDKFQVALSRVLQGLNHSLPVLTPAEALIAIHGIDPDRDGIPLKKAMIVLIMSQMPAMLVLSRHIFSQQVLAKVLNQLVEQIPLPLLFMRTVLQAIGAFPSLGVKVYIVNQSGIHNGDTFPSRKQADMEISKAVVGFMKCALLTKPQSFSVLLQLPTAQLENALNRTPALKAPLVAHANQPHIRSSLPRSTLVALGLVSEPQTSNQTQPTQTQTAETGNSEMEAAADKSKESSTAS